MNSYLLSTATDIFFSLIVILKIFLYIVECRILIFIYDHTIYVILEIS